MSKNAGKRKKPGSSVTIIAKSVWSLFESGQSQSPVLQEIIVIIQFVTKFQTNFENSNRQERNVWLTLNQIITRWFVDVVQCLIGSILWIGDEFVGSLIQRISQHLSRQNILGSFPQFQLIPHSGFTQIFTEIFIKYQYMVCDRRKYWYIF